VAWYLIKHRDNFTLLVGMLFCSTAPESVKVKQDGIKYQRNMYKYKGCLKSKFTRCFYETDFITT